MRGKTVMLKLGMRKPAMEAVRFCSHSWSSPRPKWMTKKIRMSTASANHDTLTLEREGDLGAGYTVNNAPSVKSLLIHSI